MPSWLSRSLDSTLSMRHLYPFVPIPGLWPPFPPRIECTQAERRGVEYRKQVAKMLEFQPEDSQSIRVIFAIDADLQS